MSEKEIKRAMDYLKEEGKAIALLKNEYDEVECCLVNVAGGVIFDDGACYPSTLNDEEIKNLLVKYLSDKDLDEYLM